jgi:SAM-dependent methyltransferase
VPGRRQNVLVRATLASAGIPPRLMRGTRAAINGVWLGLLSDASLRLLDERYYDDSVVYRTDKWNEHGLFDWERDLIDEHFRRCHRIVVLACGGGREVLALLDEGFDATGYEPHPALVRCAHRFLAAHGHESRVHPAPRDEFPQAAGPADGVVVGWGGFSLIHGRARRIALLSEARRRLPPGGPVLLSFFARPSDGRELRMTKAAATSLRRLRGRPPAEVGDTLAPNLVHVFTRTRLAEELRAADFELAAYRVIGPADETTSYASAVVRAPLRPGT